MVRRATLGVVRAITDPDNTAAEFAILVRSDLKGRGLGRALLGKIITVAEIETRLIDLEQRQVGIRSLPQAARLA